MNTKENLTECYFIPNKKETSATVCANCGKEKMIHTIGEGIKASKMIIQTESSIDNSDPARKYYMDNEPEPVVGEDELTKELKLINSLIDQVGRDNSNTTRGMAKIKLGNMALRLLRADFQTVEQQIQKQYAEKGNQLGSIVGSIPDLPTGEEEQMVELIKLSHKVIVNEQEGNYDHETYSKWYDLYQLFKEKQNK